MIEQLRAETKALHLQLDQSFYPMVQQVKTIDEYVDILVMFYGFYQPMQQQFDKFLGDAMLPGYSARRKPSSLINDIDVYTPLSYHIQYCKTLPVIDNLYQALGAFYVLEGATMGGTIISKKIAGNIGMDDLSKGFSFFNGYGEKNPSMWKDFLSYFENVADIKDHQQEVINAAQQTFQTFYNWINLYHANSKQRTKQAGTFY